MQIIKGWVDQQGASHEKIYNIAWSGNRSIDKEGQLPAIGNTVDRNLGTYKNTIGSAELTAHWVDPQFDANQRALLCASTGDPNTQALLFDKIALDQMALQNGPETLQERAYSSPIWYTPSKNLLTTVKAMFSKLIKEPLFQFLLIAFVLLLAERLILGNSYNDDQYRIYVDDQVLQQYLQIRAKAFNQSEAKNALSKLSEDMRQQLVDDYIRDEVLFREALALNLDNNDQLIRRRLIQKMEYLSQGFYDDIPVPTEADLRQYYQKNPEIYRQPAEITFTHIF